MTFFGYHGVFPPENQLGQRFVVDLTMWCDLAAAGASDDLQDTVNYADVFRYGEKKGRGGNASGQGGGGTATPHTPISLWLVPRTLSDTLPHRETQAIVEGPPYQLIETVAHTVAARVLEQQQRVSAVRVVVSKPHVAIPGVLRNVGTWT